jgi:hypothetical protein
MLTPIAVNTRPICIPPATGAFRADLEKANPAEAGLCDFPLAAAEDCLTP